MSDNMDIFEMLKKLNIEYDILKHQAVYTVEEAKQIKNMIPGEGCKNLFLTDKKGRYFLYVILEDKRADLNKLRKILKVSRLTFGNEEELMELVGLEKGSVTPLGIVNDKENKVVLLIDKDLVDKRILMHPNVNTMTVSMMYSDLVKIVEYCKHEMEIIDI